MLNTDSPVSGDYDASSILILATEEAKRRFGFVEAADLAVRYPAISSEFIVRLLFG